MKRKLATVEKSGVEQRNSRVDSLWQLLGGKPEAVPLKVRWGDTAEGATEVDGRSVPWVRRDLYYHSEPGVRVPAWLFTSPAQSDGTGGTPYPGPAVLYLHSHSGEYGRGRAESLAGKKRVPSGLAPRLVASGFSVFAADFRCFGDRSGERESESARRHLLHGSTLWGRMLWDQVCALDLLETLPDVDPQRIGCFGFSMGSTAGWWLAALDSRIAAGAGLCCLSTYRAMADAGVLHRHGIYYFVPRAAQIGVPGILSLIAPRPFLFLNGELDQTSPVEGAREAVRLAAETCRSAGISHGLNLEIMPARGHELTPEMIHRSLNWLTEKLQGGR
jgi:dienelactone hydrolase